MKIHTRLKLAVWVYALVACVTGVALVFSYHGIIFFLIASTFPLTFVLLRMMKNTAASFAILHKGVEIVAAGDLNHRIGLPVCDEFGEFAEAFDCMIERLRDTTVSMDELGREIRDRRAAEEELRLKQEWLRVLISSIGDAVIAADTSGRIIFINPVAASLTGSLPAEALSQPIQQVLRTINEETREPAEDIVSRVLGEGCVLKMADTTALIRRDGREIPIEESAAPIRESGGGMIGVVIVFRDVTERRGAEQALRNSRAALLKINEELERRVRERTAKLKKRAAQLARLSSELTLAEQRERRRLAEVLHDHLQQLLVAAKMNCEILSGRIGSDQKQTAENITNLINLSIQASRSLTAELSPPFLKQGGLFAALEWLARWMRENHGLTVELKMNRNAGPEREDITVLLFQSVRELLFNVVKHARVESACIELSRDEQNRFRMSVIDQGIGFDPGSIREKEKAGTGFGLFSIRERLTLLGGSFEIESSPGRGACFSLVLPPEMMKKEVNNVQIKIHRLIERRYESVVQTTM